jgi:putative tricarboxylic transport membrane protein
MITVAAVYYAIAAGIPQSGLADAIGPAGLPKAYAGALALLSIALIAGTLAPHRSTPIASARVLKPGRTAVMLAIGAAYAAVAGWVGYIPALAGLILAAIYCQGGARIPIRRALLIALAGAILFWMLFVLVLRVPQPTAPTVW